MIVETGKAVGSEGLVAGQVVDIKSEGQAEKVPSNSSIPAPHNTLRPLHVTGTHAVCCGLYEKSQSI